jgi:hypothetical protein
MRTSTQEKERSDYFPGLQDRPVEDYYETLQVSIRAEQDIIEAAFRKLAFKYHPDRNSAPEATLKMQQINRAYSVLKDPLLRENYDAMRYSVPLEVVKPCPDETESTEHPVNETPLYDWESLEYDPPRRIMPGWQRSLLYIFVGLIMLLLLATGLNAFKMPVGLPETRPTETSRLSPPGVLFFDDFDTAGAANWNLDAPWHLTTRLSESGGYSLWLGEENLGKYQIGLNVSATLVRPVDLGDAARPTIIFDILGQSDNPQKANGQDKLLVEVAIPGKDFVTVQTINTLYGAWKNTRIDLSNWKGNAVLVRLRFVSGPGNVGNNYAGYFIDNFRLEN